MKQDNPKHNPLARRQHRGKWINGVFVSREILDKAQSMRMAMMAKEAIFPKLKWWEKLYYFFKRLWRKLF